MKDKHAALNQYVDGITRKIAFGLFSQENSLTDSIKEFINNSSATELDKYIDDNFSEEKVDEAYDKLSPEEKDALDAFYRLIISSKKTKGAYDNLSPEEEDYIESVYYVDSSVIDLSINRSSFFKQHLSKLKNPLEVSICDIFRSKEYLDKNDQELSLNKKLAQSVKDNSSKYENSTSWFALKESWIHGTLVGSVIDTMLNQKVLFHPFGVQDKGIYENKTIDQDEIIVDSHKHFKNFAPTPHTVINFSLGYDTPLSPIGHFFLNALDQNEDNTHCKEKIDEYYIQHLHTYHSNDLGEMNIVKKAIKNNVFVNSSGNESNSFQHNIWTRELLRDPVLSKKVLFVTNVIPDQSIAEDNELELQYHLAASSCYPGKMKKIQDASISAPGSFVISLPEVDCYQVSTGTSLAAPVVSSLAATIWDVNPNLAPEEVVQIIKDTATDIGTREHFGNGFVNYDAALKMAYDTLDQDRPSLSGEDKYDDLQGVNIYEKQYVDLE